MIKFFKLYEQKNGLNVIALIGNKTKSNIDVAGEKIGEITILVNTDYYSYIKIKAAAVRVNSDVYKQLCLTYGQPSAPWYPGPRKETIKKSSIDKETFELRKQLQAAQYRPADEVIEWRGYTFRAGNAAAILKRMNSEFLPPSKKQLSMFATEEAAPVVDVAPAAAEEAPAAPVVDTPADEKTAADTPPVKKAKQLAVWHDAVVEVLNINADENKAIVKFKGGTMTSVPADELEPTTAKKTSLPDWVKAGAVISLRSALNPDREPGIYTIECVKNTTIYYKEGYKSMINYFMHYAAPVVDVAPAAAEEAPAAPVVDVAPAAAEEAPAAPVVDVAPAAAEEAPAGGKDAAATPDNMQLQPLPPVVYIAEAPAIKKPRRRPLSFRPLFRRMKATAFSLLPLFIACVLYFGCVAMGCTEEAAAASDIPNADDVIYYAGQLHPVTITDTAPSNQKTVCTPTNKKTAPAQALAVDDVDTLTIASTAAPAQALAVDDADTLTIASTAADNAPATPNDAPATADDTPDTTTPDTLTPTTSSPAPIVLCAGTAWQYTMNYV